MEKSFGAFISEKRRAKQLTLRGFAKLIGISPVYASNIENSLRPAPSCCILQKITEVLVLNEVEKTVMLDLAVRVILVTFQITPMQMEMQKTPQQTLSKH